MQLIVYLSAMWKAIIAGIVSCLYVLALNNPLGSLPPPGKFFSPFHGFWKNAEPANTLTQSQGKRALTLDGLQEQVQVVFDERMVPHIFAQNDPDLYLAQGYLTARFRLWQLDISTRSAAGRVSEILGDRALKYDQAQRQLGLAFAAENAIKGWKNYPETYRNLEAYAAGINAYIESLRPGDLPLEFKLLNYKPELWTPYHSALFIESMAAMLCGSEHDLENTNLRNLLGEEIFDDLFPELNPIESPIIPAGTEWKFSPQALPDTDGEQSNPDLGLRYGDANSVEDHSLLGSNNWAVAGEKTASGQPILCNDPHLNLTLPSIWYEVQLITPTYNCYGVSLPCIPGVIIGWNEDIAWGATNAGLDVIDWYKLEWADSAKTQYLLDGAAQEVTYRIEKYRSKSGNVLTDTVKYSIWGPISETGPYQDMAMRWSTHDVPVTDEVGTFLALNKAKNASDFVHALEGYHAPAQNFAYADKFGNIALRIGGKLPLKRPQQGRFVQDGSRSENLWPGYVPPRHNPISMNPERYFISSANQRSTDTTYPYYYLGTPYFEDYRGRHLNQRLSGLNDITPDDMEQLQYDNFSLKAAEILPLILMHLDTTDFNSEEQAIYAILNRWNFEYTADARAPVFFEKMYDQLRRNTWDEFDTLLSADLVISRPESWRLIKLAADNPEHAFFDDRRTQQRENFTMIARRTFREVVRQSDGAEPEGWSAYQRTTIRHLGNIGAFDYETTGAPGHADALNATRRSNGPSWRMVVTFDPLPVARVVYPGGQSGNPGSPFYDQMIDAWASGQYYTPHYLYAPGELEQSLLTISMQPE